MKLIKAGMEDLETVKNFYRELIAKTTDMEKYARWQWNLHPTEKLLAEYIKEGAMYLLMEQNKPAGAMAVTPTQKSDYHGIAWNISAADEEVAVLHILGVAPEYQGKGIGKQMMEEALGLAKASEKKALRLDALASNTPAQHLYLGKGFVYCGKKNLYADNTGWTDFFFYEYALAPRPAACIETPL